MGNGSTIPIFENGVVKVVPSIMQQDGMLLRPGFQLDDIQNILLGGTVPIDIEFIRLNLIMIEII